ncbi:MAG: hypothetical protein HY881_09855 [Deltaproteobacteria bacterium]|nr:hypothetical protein [Deltaproteobacteria bacterium]
MNAKDNALSALLSSFPTQEAWMAFSQNKDNILIRDSFVNFAVRFGLIKTRDTPSLEAFILKHTVHRTAFKPPGHLDFEELLDKRKDYLRINLSLRALTERINALLTEKQIALPKVTNSMLTRLKNEPVNTAYKQNVLRSLAFWLAYERSDIASDWHYGTLLSICREGKQTESYKEGARIGFALYSRGDVIDHEILGWLRKTLKNYIDESISHFSYGRWGKVKAHDITTLYVDFPKEKEAGDLVSYQHCLRSAADLAHQITIRWALSRYCTKNRFLSIAIAAGEYSGLDNYLLPMLNAKLSDDPVIRVSDYARQCLLINDIRVVLCQNPKETALFNGEALTIWWVTALWSSLYFDFVSDLLTDKILQNNPAAIEKLNRLLLFPEELDKNTGKAEEPNAVSSFFKFPHNSLLGVEIAKTLYYRQRFEEALEILRIVLSINPTDLIARTLRMVLFRNMAVEAETYPIAQGLFKKAEQEAIFIQNNCSHQFEDFYCEYGVVFIAQAMLTLRHSRSNKEIASDRKTIRQLKQRVFKALDRADDLFDKGMTVSPSGIRSSYLLTSARLLTAILQNDEDIFVNPNKPVDADFKTVRNPSWELHNQIGIVRRDLPEKLNNEFTEKSMMKKIQIHDDAISLQSYRTTTYFCNAVALWDYLSVRTVGTTKFVLNTLRKSIEIARTIEKDDVCIYSYTRTYGEMIPVAEFIGHLEKCIAMIEAVAGKDVYDREDAEIISRKGPLSSLLMTVNFS